MTVLFTTRKYDKQNRIISSINNLGMLYLYKYSGKNTELIIINSNGKGRLPFMSYEMKSGSETKRRVEFSDIYMESWEFNEGGSIISRYNIDKKTSYKKITDLLESNKFMETEIYRDREGKVQKNISFTVDEHIINFKQQKNV